MCGSVRAGLHAATQSVCSQRPPFCALLRNSHALRMRSNGHLQGAGDSAEVVDSGANERIARRHGRDAVLPLRRGAAGLVHYLHESHNPVLMHASSCQPQAQSQLFSLVGNAETPFEGMFSS